MRHGEASSQQEEKDYAGAQDEYAAGQTELQAHHKISIA